MYFYELHEGEDDVFSDVMLVHDVEFDEEQFLELVLEARRSVIDSFEDDTLVEAVANELERRNGFTHVTDQRIRAAVNVAVDEEKVHLAEVDEPTGDGELPDAEFRSLLIEADPEDRN